MVSRSESASVGVREFEAARGFLSAEDPLTSFGPDAHPSLKRFDRLCESLPQLVGDDRIRRAVDTLDRSPADLIDSLSDAERLRLYAVTAGLTSAYVHHEDTAGDTVPAELAIPLYEASTRLGRSPVLSYDGYVLANWRLADPERGFEPDNIETLFQFTDLRDERWFVAVHVAIEAAASPAIERASTIRAALHRDDTDRIVDALQDVRDALDDAVSLLELMPKHTRPEAFTNRFRPYLTPLRGVVYEGVPALDGPQTFSGASGAQSSLFVALDALFGINHDANPLVDHLRSLLADVPLSHRRFIRALESGNDLHTYCQNQSSDDLRESYNECIDFLTTFRKRHVEIVNRYLDGRLDDATGTGGTPYSVYLEEFIGETADRRL